MVLAAIIASLATPSPAVAAAAKARSGAATALVSAQAQQHPSTKRTARRHRITRQAPPPVVPLVDAHAVTTDPAAVAREFGGWLDELAAADTVAGLAVAVVKDDKVLLERGIGLADAGSGEAVTPTTVFRLASLSKAFATTITGLLVADGRLQWDTRVADLLPTFALSNEAAGSRLTVQDVLSHRVGLPHNTYDRLLEQDEPYEVLVERLRDVPMTCPVGDCYGYQNIAFSLIGDVVFATTADFYYHQVEKRIFHPLGMRTATFGREALETSPSWARPHRRVGGSWVPFSPAEAYYRVAPAAGVNASLRDMEQWLIAQMGERPAVLSPTLLETLRQPLVETRRELRSTAWRRGRLRDAHYALGWRIYDYAGERLVFHAGAVQGYRAMIAFLPERRFGVVMLWNCASAAPAGLLPMLLDRYLGLPDVNWAGIDRDSESDDAERGLGGTR
ncbi:MAG: beta-lactamase family protein [Dokdonella sp.]|nr:beta-lactamase family protein [Dokdonella sp.]